MAACPSCGTENPDGFRLCGMCGRMLEPPDARQERRVVSVVFADLVGFTGRAEGADVEDVERLLGRYYAALRAELERHGGLVEKFIGDAVVALFGLPAAHEDDPERAVRAGLAIQAALAGLREREPIDLHVRVGVTTGEVLVAWREGVGGPQALGDVVNTAARLQAAAPTDAVLVDATTHRACRPAIVFAAAEPVNAKGKAEPVAVWRALRPVSSLPAQVRNQDLPLVGRQPELSQLMAVARRSHDEPSTQLVTLIGAPGIGKTRLLRELEGRPEDARWLRGRSLAYGEGIAFWAFGEIVKQAAGVLESDAGDAAASRLAALVQGLLGPADDAAWVLRHLRPLVGIDAQPASADRARGEAFAAWRRFVEALARDRATVLVFEDAHWADDALLDFVELLADRAGAVPLLLVCTGRPELLERRPTWGGGATNATTVTLQPLSEPDIAALVSALLDQELLHADATHVLLGRAEGNPLYAQEYVRMLLDRGALVRGGDGWELAGAPDQVPESIYGVIAARLDTASAAERRFVQDASVVGKTGWIGAVCALSGASSWDAEDALHHLERRQLMRRLPRSTIDGDVEFSFSHALVRDVAYQQIPRAQRAAKHEAAARWIERLERDREDAAELVAHHWTSALRLRRDLGEDVGPLAERAASALVAAGRQAESVHGYEAAHRHFCDARSLLPAAAPSQPTIAYRAAMSAFLAGRDDAAAALEEAFHLLESAGDSWAASEAGQLQGEWWFERRDWQRAVGWWVKAERHAKASGNQRVLSHIAENRISVLDAQDRHAEAAAMGALAVRQARAAGDDEGVGLLLRQYGFQRLCIGELDGLTDIAEAVELLVGLENRYAVWAYVELAQAQGFMLGDLAGGRRSIEEACRWAARFGEARLMEDAAIRRAWFAYQEGAWDEARRIIHRHLRERFPWGRFIPLWIGGLIAVAEGDDETARGHEEALRELDPRAATLLALVEHAGGRAEQAASMARDALARPVRDEQMLGSVLAELIEIPGACEPVRKLASALHAANGWRAPLLAAADGRFADAADGLRAMGSLPAAARADGMAAVRALGDRDVERASTHARRAARFFAGVGATRYAEQLRQLIGAAPPVH